MLALASALDSAMLSALEEALDAAELLWLDEPADDAELLPEAAELLCEELVLSVLLCELLPDEAALLL